MTGRTLRAVLAAAVIAIWGPAQAAAGDAPDPRDALGGRLGEDQVEIAPGESVGLFAGSPSYHRTLLRWPEPGGMDVVLTLDYSGSVSHHRFDFTAASAYVDAEAAFGEWSLGLNGHVLWTANLAPYLFNGEVPGQPHRDASGLVVDGCWRTSGYSICDKAYASGGSNGDVELASSEGAPVAFGYPGNLPTSGNPAMLPNDPSLAWRASLAPPAYTRRALTVKKPDGSTWTFDEVPLTLRWPGYSYNNNEGPRAFRLSRVAGPTPGCSLTVRYEYADSGGGRSAWLHPTAVRVTDQSGRSVNILVDASPQGGECHVSVVTSYGPGQHELDFSERWYTDRAARPRRSYLYYLDHFTDRTGRVTGFRHEPDDRSEAWLTNCSDSADVRAMRLAGVDYPEGGSSTYGFVPLPATRPACPDPTLRGEDGAWRATGRSPCLAPMVSRVEIREAAGQAPVQVVALAYDWSERPAVGAPFESDAYRYLTNVDYDGGPPLSPSPPAGGAPGASSLPAGAPGPGAPVASREAARAAALASGFRMVHTFRKYPCLPQTHGGPTRSRWAARLVESSVSLACGETHALAMDYDAVPEGDHYTGTLLPASKTFRATSAGAPLGGYTTTTTYDSLARVTACTDAAGVRTEVEYFDAPGLHQPWSGTGRYSVQLPARARRLAPVTGALLSETWYEREPAYGRVTAEHIRLDDARVATRTFSWSETEPSRMVRATGPLGEAVEFEYDPRPIPNTIAFADCPGGAYPVMITLHPDAGSSLQAYQSFGWEGELLREADGAGHLTSHGYDAEGRERTRALPGDVMTGPPPPTPRSPVAPRGALLPPYDLTVWPSRVLTRTSGAGYATDYAALYPAMLESLLAVCHLDGLGRPRSLRRAGESGAAMEYAYDAFGRLVQAGRAGAAGVTYTHDELGRPTAEAGPAGTTRVEHRTVPDLQVLGLGRPGGTPGFCAVEIARHPGGVSSLRARDARGLLLAAAEYAAGASVPFETRYYEYDAAGRVTAWHAPGGHVTRFHHDLAGHRLLVENPDGSRRVTVWDLAGRPVFTRDERGAAGAGWTCLRYDALGRLLEEATSAGLTEASAQALADAGALPADSRWTARYSYDGSASPGSLTRVETRDERGAVDVVELDCDGRGRVVRKTCHFAGVASPLSLEFEYDRLDRVTSIIYPDGRRVNHYYDPATGRVARLEEHGSGRELAAFTRDAAGRVAAQRAGALEQRWERDAGGAPVSQVGQSRGRTLFQEFHERDPDGRCAARAAAGGVRWDFARDPAGRLASVRFSSEPGSPAVTYRHAPGGELDSVGSDLESAAFDLDGPRLSRVRRAPHGREEFAYDAGGALAERTRLVGSDTLGALTLAWSSAGRLVTVAGRAADVTDSAVYGYDARGWRTRRRVGGVTTFQLRDEDGTLLAEADSSGRVLREYVRAGARLLGTVERDGAFVAYLCDALGSVRLGVDEDGAVRFQQEFLPYGELSRFEGADRPTLGFLGAEQDPETGWCYLVNRFYDPGTARFVSPDPLRDSGAPPYGYAFGDPLTYADPEGLAGSPVDAPAGLAPRYILPPVIVRGTIGVPDKLLLAIRLLKTVGGDRAGEQGRKLYQAYLAVTRAARSIHDGLLTFPGKDATLSVVAGLGRVCPVVTRAVVRGAVTKVPATRTLDRAMIGHQLVAGIRVQMALENARGLTPVQVENARLASESVLLGETTLDLLGVLAVQAGLATPPVGVMALLTWGGLRPELSDLSDDILSRVVPGYANTSVLDGLFGPVWDDAAEAH
ncbi:MAG: RHS repeat-associated core domain-containing protein [Candidatus Eisenbacteria bacterium]|nr:RHS repeat-associated core domain-containing protein [Candidatus Eisenbacteria bacterium]